MDGNTDERELYETEQRRFLHAAHARGLLSVTDARRLHAAYEASARRGVRRPAAILPRLLLDAEDGAVLERLEHPEHASDRWSLYERIREQTQERCAA